MKPHRLFFFLCLVFPAAGRCEEAPEQEQEPEPALEDLVNITFKNDARVFAVMAALNVAGFDYERSGKNYSPEREWVRRRLEGVDPDLALRLENFYREHRRYRDEVRESA
jgi:hypothetical protein